MPAPFFLMPVVLHPPGFRLAFAEVARREMGVVEDGENSGASVRKYQGATDLDPAAWRWCAAFVCWCYREAAASLAPGCLPTRPTTALAYGFESWGADHARLFRVPHVIIPGDIVIMKFSHVGICSDRLEWPGVFLIEGNTSLPGSFVEGVCGRYRSLSSVRSIVRLYESTTPQA
jgi:hypothetical protein